MLCSIFPIHDTIITKIFVMVQKSNCQESYCNKKNTILPVQICSFFYCQNTFFFQILIISMQYFVNTHFTFAS